MRRGDEIHVTDTASQGVSCPSWKGLTELMSLTKQ